MLSLQRRRTEDRAPLPSAGQSSGFTFHAVRQKTFKSLNDSKIEIRAEVDFPGFRIVDQELGVAGADDFAFVNEVSAVNELEGLAHVVVGDEDSQAAVAKAADNLLDFVD